MNPISLNVIVQVSKNKSSYFLELIRVNSNRQKTSNYLFDYLHQPINLHPIFESKLNHKKGKQLIYLTLEGNEVNSYFEVSTQKFKFNGVYLKEETSDNALHYSHKLEPNEFINRFKSNNLKESDPIKSQLLLDLIPESDKKDLIPKMIDGFSTLCVEFVKFYESKYLAHKKSLFNFNDASNLKTYVDKKLEYFQTMSSFKFTDVFEMIKLNLSEDQIVFLNNMNVKDVLSLKAAASLYDKFKSTLPPTTTTSIFAGLVLTPTYTIAGGFNTSLVNPGQTSLMDYSILEANSQSIQKSPLVDDTYQSNLPNPTLDNNESNPTVGNLEFRENAELITMKDNLFSNSHLEKLLENEPNSRLKTNIQLSILPDTTSEEANKIDKATKGDNFLRNRYLIDDNTKLPIINFENPKPVQSKPKTPKLKKTNKRKASETSFYCSSTNRKKYEPQGNKIESYIKRQREAVKKVKTYRDLSRSDISDEFVSADNSKLD